MGAEQLVQGIGGWLVVVDGHHHYHQQPPPLKPNRFRLSELEDAFKAAFHMQPALSREQLDQWKKMRGQPGKELITETRFALWMTWKPGSRGFAGCAEVFKLSNDDDSRASTSTGIISRGGKSRGRDVFW